MAEEEVVPEEVPVEKPKKIGKKGVLAKRASIERKVAEIQVAVEAQAKENEAAVKVFQPGVKELQRAIKAYVDDFYYG
ncbi:MAG: hypothetical protein QMD78_01295 [Methanocellales archaeon]|nr:hypothetical protein [Methanocellales archaeon]